MRKADVDGFLRQYIFGTETADRIGRFPRKVMNMLKHLAIYPLRGTSIEAGCQLVYTRTDGLARFLERYQVGDPIKWWDTVRRRQSAWERIIQKDGTPVSAPSIHSLFEPQLLRWAVPQCYTQLECAGKAKDCPIHSNVVQCPTFGVDHYMPEMATQPLLRFIHYK